MIAGNVRGMRPHVEAALRDALALLLPVECLGCGSPDRELCEECRRGLVPAVLEQGLDAPESDVPAIPVVAGLAYAGVARQVMLAFKDGDRPGLARVLAPALAAAARHAAVLLSPIEAPIILSPVPSSPAARRRRGYAPVGRLLHAAGLPGRSLLTTRGAAVQKRLSAADREENARHRMRATEDCSGLEVVLVDDVVTTGATLRAARRELEQRGARVHAAVVVAATPLRRATERAQASDDIRQPMR